ncbi:MAG: multidrug transporter permease/ATP-binding protein, partial [Paenibacillus sp.]|nr:multidrug transporter permease/ATP-binding protein [Paenibacillus sp.]
LFEPTMKIVTGASYLIGLGYGAYLVYHNELTIGGLVAFNVYLGMLIWPMFAIGELINIMQRGNASLDRVNTALDWKPDVVDPADVGGASAISAEQPGAIEFRNVTFRYPSSQSDNLRDVTFRLEPGQTLGIVGRTGSGKTTLIKQLLREYPPGQGVVALSGMPIEEIGMDRLKSWYGYVPQQQFLFSRSIKANILFGAKGGQASDEQLRQAIQASALAGDLAVMPDGLDTMVGERGVSLSGGQKQRVSIARALIADPDILMLDDALSAVDARTEAEIVEHVRTVRSGKTTFIVTHRLSAVQQADWILVLDDGAIVEQGNHEQLMRIGGWYKDQFELQQVANEAEGGESQLERL